MAVWDVLGVLVQLTDVCCCDVIKARRDHRCCVCTAPIGPVSESRASWLFLCPSVLPGHQHVLMCACRLHGRMV